MSRRTKCTAFIWFISFVEHHGPTWIYGGSFVDEYLPHQHRHCRQRVHCYGFVCMVIPLTPIVNVWTGFVDGFVIYIMRCFVTLVFVLFSVAGILCIYAHVVKYFAQKRTCFTSNVALLVLISNFGDRQYCNSLWWTSKTNKN